MTDLISRQTAIMDAESWVAVDEYEKNLQKKVVEWLKEFPPAQPEIIRCKDCQHSEYDAVYGDRYCHYCGKAEVVKDDHYCGYAERMTDESN